MKKSCLFLTVFITFLLSLEIVIAVKYNIQKKVNPIIKHLSVGSLALANLLKRLGSNESIVKLTLRIQNKCRKGKILKSWLKIVKSYGRLIKNSTKYPYIHRNFWHLGKNKRIQMFKKFVETFVNCGNVQGARSAINKISQTYNRINHVPLSKMVQLTRQVKRIFFRKKIIKNDRDNNTIYKYRLILKIVHLKRNLKKCLHSRKMCLFYAYRCRHYRTICTYVKSYRASIIDKVRETFAYYFSIVFTNLINFINSFHFRRFLQKKQRKRRN
jgi:hypothetical protein